LYLVLIISVSHDRACKLLEELHDEAPTCLWPSAVYGLLARAMLSSELAWRRGAGFLDQLLQPWLAQLGECAAIDLARRVSQWRESYNAAEFAALLWTLLRRREPAFEALLRRMTEEVAVAVIRSGGRSGTRPDEQRRTAAAYWE
jgi:hypothetical protein